MGFGKFNHATARPTVQDVMQQAATYGATIPVVFGTVLMPPLIIWLNGIKKQSGKKSSKKGNTTYTCQIDTLLGHNPIQTVEKAWRNGPYGYGSSFDHFLITGAPAPTYTITDPQFHHVYAVTITLSYNFTYNDYGSSGPVHLTGNYEMPLWNTAIKGPDPTNNSGYKWSPYTYFCQPGSNVVSQLNIPGNIFNIYYSAIPLHGWGANHIALQRVLNMYVEHSLGEGTEWTNFTSQQIIYPMFAGAASDNFDLGSGTTPQMKLEVLGSYTLYPYKVGGSVTWSAADCDFADMIEHILRQGFGQGSVQNTNSGVITGFVPMQSGCGAYNFPGTYQKKFWSNDLGSFSGSMQFDVPVTQGSILVAIADGTGSGTFAVSDTNGNTWTTVTTSTSSIFAYATNNTSGPNTVNFTNVPVGADVYIFEIIGCDTVDSATVANASSLTNPTGTITTTQSPGQQAYLLTWVFPDTVGTVGSGSYIPWNQCVLARGQGGNFFGIGPHNSYAFQRLVNAPGTYTFTGDAATSTWKVVMLALKNSVAPANPKAFPDILDNTTLDQSRMQCRANGLFGSLVMNSQKKASDWLASIYEAANTAPVWSGFKLKSIPRSEVTAAGNGVVYTPPTASGPVANLTPYDMVGSDSSPVVTITRKAVIDRPDLLKVQYPERSNQYRSAVVSQPDPGSLTLYGLRYASPKTFEMVADTSVAQSILDIMVKRQTQLVNTYEFTLQARFKLLEAMDLITITDPLIGLNQQPVRLISVEEDADFNLKCKAEDFIYGVNAPKAIPNPATPTPVNPSVSTIPLPVNTPVFIEPPGALTGVPQNQFWIGISDSDPLYGGSQAFVSVDGGATYNPLLDVTGSSLIFGSATTGVTTATWPQALDPDTTNNLSLDLSESLGALSQYTVTEEDQFLYPCYVSGGGGVYPFEIMTYAVATLTGTYLYTLQATGVGNKLRRAVFGTWASSVLQNTGASHPGGSRFLFLDPSSVGIMKVNTPASWYGKTIFFKFVQFNVYNNGQSTLAAAVAYSYTFGNGNNTGGGGTGGSGGSGNSTYTINPTNPLSQTSTTNIHMVNVTATFSPSGLQTFYVARNFTISAPGSPTTYYVTIFDPNFTGDTGNTATLTAFCTTTQAGSHVGQAGYISMGSIVVTPSGSSAGGQGGGSNPSGSITIQIPIPSTTSGDFSIAHGLGKVPADVDIKIQSDGLIRFQPGTMWDANNVYLNASDNGLTGTLVIEL